MEGDWYARKMYQQGSADYKDHLARFGHPSTNGWKDIIPLWKAEKWEPEKLMALYKKAGAKYFVSMGVHHDDFFLWNSPLHQWNAVNYGPHRDVVGDWQKAAKKNGLPFGVSEHLGASFTWFQDAHKADKTGPLAGVPYDGANSNYWDLYHFPAEPGDAGWYSKNPRWQRQWFNEIKELVDQLSSRSALQRRRRGVRQRSRFEPDCQSLQRQRPASSRQTGRRLYLQATLWRSLGAGL